ncbi:MAG: hypothetical protein ABIW76_22035 [Fibrobacteria bacterium]
MPSMALYGAPTPKPGIYRDRLEVFRKSLRSYQVETRRVDSLQYVLGELDYLREAYDSALGIHLSIPLPASGNFRDSVLAQRARIFDRIWPTTVLSEEEAFSRPTLEWEIGSGHFRGFYQAGPVFPYGQDGMGFSTRAWLFHTQACLTWPLSLHGQKGSFAAQARLSPSQTSPDHDLVLRANAFDVFRKNLSLAGSAGLRKVAGQEYLASFSLSSSRFWPSEMGSISIQAYVGGDWQKHGGMMNGNAGMGFIRSTYLAGESYLDFSLDGAILSRSAVTDGFQAQELYVDNVAGIRPTHFQGPEFRDTLSKDDPSPYELYVLHTGAQSLSLRAPQTFFSATSALGYGFSLFAGWQARAETHYGIDLYPEYAWDEAPGPVGLEPFSGDFNGLALNRADGRRYAVVLIDEQEGLGEYYGSSPLEHRKMRRLDQKAGLDFSLSRFFGGQFLTLGTSAEFGWSNLPRTAPAFSTPWQWNVNCAWSRTWGLR